MALELLILTAIQNTIEVLKKSHHTEKNTFLENRHLEKVTLLVTVFSYHCVSATSEK